VRFLPEKKEIEVSQEAVKCAIAFFLLGQLNLALIFARFSISG